MKSIDLFCVTFKKAICTLAVLSTLIFSGEATADPTVANFERFTTEKYATLPFVVWRNNLLFANAVLNRVPTAGMRDAGKKECKDICKKEPNDICKNESKEIGDEEPNDEDNEEGFDARKEDGTDICKKNGPDICKKECKQECKEEFVCHTREHLIGLGEIGEGEVKFHGRKFDYNSWGISIAADVTMTARMIVGCAFSGLMNNFTWHQHGGNGKLKHFEGAAYFNYCYGNFFVGGMATGGWSQSSCRRNIFYPGINSSYRGSQCGSDYSIHLQEGFNVCCGCWQLIPLFRVSFTSIRQNNFHEGCLNDVNLSIRPWTTSIVRAYLEGKVARTYMLQGYCITPQVFVGYAYDSVIGGKHIRAYAQPSGDNFDADVWSRNQASLVAGGEVKMICGYGVTAFARYDAQLNHRYTSQAAQLGVTYDY